MVEETAVAAGPTGNCRYGIASIPSGGVPWLAPLGSGWHHNFYPNRPTQNPGNAAEFVFTLRMHDGEFIPALDNFVDELTNYPGSMWLVGSEMEVPDPVNNSSDSTRPADYAVAYKTAYDFIKLHDPTARVGIGGMSMATPMRLAYLSLVWDSYQQTYEQPMPVDIWNTHIYIFAERIWNSTVPYDGQLAWDVDPLFGRQNPGNNESRCTMDEVYCRKEHDSLTIFQQQVVAFRQWMKDHEQQNKPFIISEIALLYPYQTNAEYGGTIFFTTERVNNYMDGVFDYLQNDAIDANLGYPADGNRLVQQWLWYSLNVPDGIQGRISNLLVDNYASYPDSDLGALTSVGQNYKTWVDAQSKFINLKAGEAQNIVTEAEANGLGSANLEVSFRNDGTSTINQPFSVTFYADAALTQPIGTQVFDAGMAGCAWGFNTHSATAVWNNLPPGQYTYWAKIDSNNEIGESGEGDNVTSGAVTITQNPAPILTVSPQGANAWLTWTDIQIADHYDLFRDTNPYFTPANAHATPSIPEYSDNNVLANPGAFYYLVRAVDAGSQTYPLSNRVGVFSFGVTPGDISLLAPQIDIEIDDNGTDTVVSWPAVSNASSYDVFRQSNPYDSAGAPHDNVNASPFVDSGDVQVMENRYYRVRAINGGSVSPLSNEVGKFVFQITAGS